MIGSLFIAGRQQQALEPFEKASEAYSPACSAADIDHVAASDEVERAPKPISVCNSQLPFARYSARWALSLFFQQTTIYSEEVVEHLSRGESYFLGLTPDRFPTVLSSEVQVSMHVWIIQLLKASTFK